MRNFATKISVMAIGPPCPPEFQAEHNISTWHLELTRFFAHPEIVTVGITSDRGHEELAYVPQLQSFRITIDGKDVGSLTLMADHVVGSFHQHGRQYDVMHKAGNRYVLADMNLLLHHKPFACGCGRLRQTAVPLEPQAANVSCKNGWRMRGNRA